MMENKAGDMNRYAIRNRDGLSLERFAEDKKKAEVHGVR